MRYIIGVKPNDHNYLFEFVHTVKMEEKEERDRNGTRHRYRWFNHAPLKKITVQLKILNQPLLKYILIFRLFTFLMILQAKEH